MEHEAANSTTDAVRTVRRVNRPWAAIGKRLAADLYECPWYATTSRTLSDNRTRFVYLARTPAPQDLEHRLQDQHRLRHRRRPAGRLAAHPQRVAYRYVNLTKIEMRPSKQGLGDYVFFIDVEGRRADPAIAEALKCLACKLPWVKVLGSYPA